MDYQLLTRVESHAVDLFKLGQDVEQGVDNKNVKKGPLFSVDKKPLSALLDVNDESKTTKVSRSRSVPFSLNTLSTLEEEEGDNEGSEQPLSPRVKSKSPVKSAKASKDDLIFQSWISMRRLPLEEQQKIHYEDLFGCFTRNFGKGFALGCGGKIILNIFSELVFILRNRKINAEVFTKLLDGARDHGLFLAMLLASHNSIMFMTRDVKHAFSRYRGTVAGFFAGLVSLVYLPSSMRRSVILFTFVRALELVCRMGVKRKLLPEIENGDTGLMSLASSMMIYTWIFHPKALDPSYQHFLTRQVQLPYPIVRGISAAQLGLPLENLDAVNKARKMMAPKGVSLADITNPFEYDSPSLTAAEKASMLLHPGQSFGQFAVSFFINAIRNAAPVYAPVYAVPLVMFSRKRLMRDPVNTIKSAALGASRSSLFLAVYCTVGIVFFSAGRRAGIRHEILGDWACILPLLSGASAGAATLIEKKQRRIELALYVLSKAVEGVYNVFKEKHGFSAPFFAESVAFALCFAAVSHANLRHPELLRESYRGLLLRFFDTDERHKFF
jgi:hypothetical protein